MQFKDSSSQWEFGQLFDEKSPSKPDSFTKDQVDDPIPVWTVSALTRQIRNLLEGKFRSVKVTGEVSNLRLQGSGHCYFTLKDGDAQLSCVLFRNERVQHRHQLEQGSRLVLSGDISVYMPRGQYQLIVRSIELDGVGMLQQAFENLKQKLKKEGLFETNRKRALPKYPDSIGIVTSASGAALRDVLSVLRRRHPGIKLTVSACRVQGDGAAEEIATSIRQLNAWHASDAEKHPMDLILVTRGGGSLEDLWAFNEEVVARSIADSPLPVVSAVGHEIDFTISDFTADVRAATPSAAAELITEGFVLAREFLEDVPIRMVCIVDAFLEQNTRYLGQLRKRLGYLHPRRGMERHSQRVDELEDAISRMAMLHLEHCSRRLETLSALMRTLHPRGCQQEQVQKVQYLQQRALSLLESQVEGRARLVSHLSAQLKLLGPMEVLSRGYSITRHQKSGEVVRSTQEVTTGDRLLTRLTDGVITSRVPPTPSKVL